VFAVAHSVRVLAASGQQVEHRSANMKLRSAQFT
jgi:hypothetical protein